MPGTPEEANLRVSGMASVSHRNSGSDILCQIKRMPMLRNHFPHTASSSPLTSFTIQTFHGAEASTGPTKPLARAALCSGSKSILQAEEKDWTQLTRNQPANYLHNEMRIIYRTVQRIFTSSD